MCDRVATSLSAWRAGSNRHIGNTRRQASPSRAKCILWSTKVRYPIDTTGNFRMPAFPEHIGPYRIVSQLGAGGMGAVFRAHDQRLDRIVALKAVHGLQTHPCLRKRSWQEARAAAKVSHPNACRLYDILEEDDHLYLVMELIEGESLAVRMRRGAVPIQEAAQIMLSILSALEAFHKAGIVHRDLKPANVMLSPEGTKVLDFGLAKQTHWNAPHAVSTTLADATISGT